MSTARTQRIVLKFGTGILTQPESGTIDHGQIQRLSTEVAALVKSGCECLLVSSGAVGAGLMTLRLAERPSELAGIQACAAVGQSTLMHLYQKAFAQHGLHVGQLLLTYGNLDSRTSYVNIVNTIDRLLSFRNVIPIINENDSVAVEELRFGDNDRLSAEVAILAGVDLLILLTTADGLLQDGQVIPEVRDIDAVMQHVLLTKGRFSVGGMASKLEAVRLALESGIPTVIANGRTPGVVADILAGKAVGTRFVPLL